MFAFVQEQRAEHAAERLRDLLPRQARVLRDGVPTTVPAEELVAGDVVLLAEGHPAPVAGDVDVGLG